MSSIRLEVLMFLEVKIFMDEFENTIMYTMYTYIFDTHKVLMRKNLIFILSIKSLNKKIKHKKMYALFTS